MNHFYLVNENNFLNYDFFQGDDGGPLIWKNVQVGIVSFLAGNRLPRVYTKISEMLPWITHVIYDNI